MILVNIEKRKRKLALSFRRYQPLIDEVKCMRGAEWDPKTTCWVVTDCRRNRMQMDGMAGRPVPELKRYEMALAAIKPRRTILKEHQYPMLRFLWTRRRAILAAEMGTMKTLPTIEVMEKAGGEWWYVSTPKVLTSIKIEFEKWGALVKPKWVSINKLHKTLEQHKGAAPLGVVFDEASFLKGKGPWYQAAQFLADAIRKEHDGYVFLLTGTPSPKDPTDWHSLVEIAAPGFLREATKPRLTQRLAIMEKMKLKDEAGNDIREFSTVVGWRKDEVEKLGRRLRGLVHVVYSKDCQSLPPMREERILLDCSPDALRAARLVAENAGTAAQVLNKVRQLSDGFQYQTDGEKTLRCETPKRAALENLLARNEEVGRFIVYAPYRESIDLCVEICVKAGWTVLRCDGRGWEVFSPKTMLPVHQEEGESFYLKEMDRSLNTGTVEKLAFVSHPRSGGFGLNLTAAREGAFFSSDFDGGAHSQAMKRAHRHGMDENRGFTWYFLCHLPTDEYVLKNLEDKRDLAKITLDEIKEILGCKTRKRCAPRADTRTSTATRTSRVTARRTTPWSRTKK